MFEGWKNDQSCADYIAGAMIESLTQKRIYLQELLPLFVETRFNGGVNLAQSLLGTFILQIG